MNRLQLVWQALKPKRKSGFEIGHLTVEGNWMEERGIYLNPGQKDLETFQHPVFGKLRAMLVFNEPWYVGSDVAKCLDYAVQMRPLSRCVATMDKHLLCTPEAEKIRPRGVVIVNTYGVKSMARLSGSPIAGEFVKWAEEVGQRLVLN